MWVIRTAPGFFYNGAEFDKTPLWRWLRDAHHFSNHLIALLVRDILNIRYPRAGVEVIALADAVEHEDAPPENTGAVFSDDELEPITYAFTVAREALDELPPSRMRAFAIADLESSFSRAIFAASSVVDPIRMIVKKA